MCQNIRPGEETIIRILFPGIYEIILRALEKKFEFDAKYAPVLFEREVADVLVSLILFGCIDFDDEFYVNNPQALSIFIEEFIELNGDTHGYLPLDNYSAYAFFQQPLP